MKKISFVILLIAMCTAFYGYAEDAAPKAASVAPAADVQAASVAPAADVQAEGMGKSYVEPISDPLEPMNRFFHGFNKALVNYIIYPVGRVYRKFVPFVIRDSVSNFADNLAYPLRAVNNCLQGRWRDAWTETERFIVNTTIGILGLFDPADSYCNLKPRRQDFGTTMGHYGVGTGCFLNLPLLGPTNVRDGLGLIVGIPFNLVYVSSNTALSDMAVRLVLLGNDVLGNSPMYKVYYDTNYDSYAITRAGAYYIREAKIHPGVTPDGLKADPDESLGGMMLKPTNPLFWERASTLKVTLPGAEQSIPVSCWPARGESHRLMFILPGLSSHRLSNGACALAELYQMAGWNVITISSTMHSEYFLGVPGQPFPAGVSTKKTMLHQVLAQAIEKFNAKYPKHAVESCSILGFSLGGLNTISLASSELPFKVDKFIAINPPRNAVYALKTIDRFYSIPETWEAATRKERTRELILRAASCLGSPDAKMTGIPVTREESQFFIGAFMRLPLADVLYVMKQEKGILVPGIKEESTIGDLMDYSWENYMKQVALPQMAEEDPSIKTFDDLCRVTRLDVMEKTLREESRLMVLHNENDCMLAEGDIEWFKSLLGKRIIVSPRGGHLGNAFMPEYQKMLLSLTGDKLQAEAIQERLDAKQRRSGFRPLSRRMGF